MYPWQNFILGLCEDLAWPLLTMIWIFYFRKDIRKVLARIKTLPLGTELNSEEMKEQREAKKDFEEEFTKIMEKQQEVNSQTNIKEGGK